MKKNTKKFFLLVSSIFLLVSSVSLARVQQDDVWNNWDLLQQWFKPASDLWTITDRWSNPWEVGNHVLNWENEIDIPEKGINTEHKDSIFSNLVNMFLTFTVIISVTMIIINWIQYITKSWTWGDPSKQRRNLLYIAIWIIVALTSVSIIQLLKTASNDLKTISLWWVVYAAEPDVSDKIQIFVPKEWLEKDLEIEQSVINWTWATPRAIISVINWYLWWIIWFLCFVFLIYNWILLITARWDQKAMTNANKWLLGSAIGIGICFASYNLVKLALNLLQL